MSCATEHRTVAYKNARLVRRETYLRRLALRKLDVEVQLAEFEAMRHISACQYKHYRLVPFQCNLARHEREFIGCHFDSAGRNLRSRRTIQQDRGQQDCSGYGEQHKSVFHKLSRFG